MIHVAKHGRGRDKLVGRVLDLISRHREVPPAQTQPLNNAAILEDSKSDSVSRSPPRVPGDGGPLPLPHFIVVPTNGQKDHEPKRNPGTILTTADKYRQETKHATQRDFRPHLWGTQL